MEVGGFDIVLTGDTAPHDAILDFLHTLLHRWPKFQALYCDREALHILFATSNGDIPGQLPSEGSISIVRDQLMKDHQGATGGELMEDGDGPLTIYYGQIDVGWRLTLVTPEDPAASSFSLWAYSEVSALLPGYLLVWPEHEFPQ